MAARFTVGQLAVLHIVAAEVTAKGVCGLCIDAIAARAGVCRRLAQGAIRLAEGDGLLTIEERRHEGRRNSPNLVRIISREWQAWTKRRRPMRVEGDGCKALHPTDSTVLSSNSLSPMKPFKKLPERQGRLHRRGRRESARVADA